MKKTILFILSLLFGLMFINSGLNKFLNYMPVPADLPPGLIKVMGAFMEIGWLMPLVGAAEIVGGLLVIIPKTRALGAIMIFPIMIGIILTHAINVGGGYEIVIPLLLINLWIIFENREKYMPMVR
ncbi:MAG: DoxX family membrane protein [Pedobacter sp.]|nr:MAG: DoxX family membrane protein [Pedobacter sp.]